MSFFIDIDTSVKMVYEFDPTCNTVELVQVQSTDASNINANIKVIVNDEMINEIVLELDKQAKQPAYIFKDIEKFIEFPRTTKIEVIKHSQDVRFRLLYNGANLPKV